MRNETTYTGHGSNTGGLQRHSIGEEYPYTLVGTDVFPPGMSAAEHPGVRHWYVMNCNTGAVGELFRTYKEARIDLARLKLRDMMHG